ncbi:MAG TPA: M2 family metallopeptidase [Thermoanaerobaculia bacterium]|nr:M2 family metallopeptidase [Thermoanaerobaculia bacterium]
MKALGFIDNAEARLAAANVEQQRAEWIAQNFITYDTQILAANANEKLIALGVELAKEAAAFDAERDQPYDVRRKLDLIKLSLTTPGPSDAKKTAELARIAASMDAMYGSANYNGLDVEGITKIMQRERDPERLLDAWRGWHSAARPMKPLYSRFVELTNEGARELGYANAGAMWRSKYDMPADAFAAEVDRLWNQVKPLYDLLHRYVRRKLHLPPDRPTPAHLLGNIWAQEWGNIFDRVAPALAGRPAEAGPHTYDLTAILESRSDIDEAGMVRIAERFFTSLGFDPLPKTFWERSLFRKPRDREVVCHASAWDLDDDEDLRVKMCISKTADYFQTVHHELGHNFYQRAYRRQPFLYKDSANDAFHEAIGDTIALSVTPGYLVEIGLLDREPPLEADIPLLLREALDKIAFLPFGILIDKWRWRVFAGEIPPADYTESWWALRLEYQGIAPPVRRDANEFDPGAKYHIAANVPYMRYFLARILQFQFHRALCQAAGLNAPLHRASIYGSRAAGARLETMLALGRSRPWPEALEAICETREMDATAMLDYFAPLREWLEAQR